MRLFGGTARHVRIYDSLKRCARSCLKRNDLEKTLVFLFSAAHYAYLNHFGVWADDEVETLLEDVSDALFGPPRPSSEKRRNEPGKVMYIASFLTPTGGHTQALRHWVECLSKAGMRQHVVITAVDNVLPDARLMSDPFWEGVDVTTLPPTEPYVERVKMLADIAREAGPDNIALFINPHDVIAVTALDHIKKTMGPKILFLNHADFVFWLGIKVIDVLVEFGTMCAEVSRKKRGYSGEMAFLPFTTRIHEGGFPSPPPLLARKGGTVSLSVGSSWKIMHDRHWNYLETIKSILEANPAHRHVLLTTSRMPSGEPSERYIGRFLAGMDEKTSERFSVFYDVSDTLPYYRAADFLIETFPVTGGIVRLEAMACGLPVVCADYTGCRIISEAGEKPPGYPFVASTNEEVIAHSNRLIRDRESRKIYGELLYDVFSQNFSFDKFSERLVRLFKEGPAGLREFPYRGAGGAQFEEGSDRCLLDLDRRLGHDVNPYLLIYLYWDRYFTRKETLMLFSRFSLSDLARAAREKRGWGRSKQWR